MDNKVYRAKEHSQEGRPMEDKTKGRTGRSKDGMNTDNKVYRAKVRIGHTEDGRPIDKYISAHSQELPV